MAFALLIGLGIPVTFIPTMPGLLFMFLMSVIYVVIDRGAVMDPWWLLLFGGLFLVSVVNDYASGLIGAKLGGATKRSVLFGVIGLVIGLFTAGPPGLFIGLFLGIFLAELVRMKDAYHAVKAASYSLVGMVVGAMINVVLAITFLVSFLILVF